MTMLREDPRARERSLMYKNPTVCDGQKDGHQCKHYWKTVDRMDVANPDELRKGKTQRFCILLGNPPFPMGERAAELSHECNQYVASDREYVAEPAENNPMTAAEVLAIRAATPTDPLLDPTEPIPTVPPQPVTGSLPTAAPAESSPAT